MDAWSTYRISDLILFSKESLFEVFETYNQDLWPWQSLWLVLAAIVLILPYFKGRKRSQLTAGILAAAWASVGLVFHGQYFEAINWAARYFAYMFVAQALLIFFAGVVFGKLRFHMHAAYRRTLGLIIFAVSAFVPFELFLGQSLSQFLGFGWGAERTAMGTIGLLVFARGGIWHAITLLIAILWIVTAALMYYGLR